MKDFLKRISVIVMSFMVLFSTLSFTVEKHICAGEVRDISFTGNLERCVMPSSSDDINSFNFDKEPCCKDIKHSVDGTNSELKVTPVVKIEVIQLAMAFVYSYHNIFQEEYDAKIHFNEYSPPVLEKDIQVLFETFQI